MFRKQITERPSTLSIVTQFSLAARNLVRNGRRTTLTVATLVFIIGSLTFLMGFLNAYMGSMKENVVSVMNGHIQIYHPDFRDTNLIDHYISDTSQISSLLEVDSRIFGWTRRVTTSGLAAVARSTTSVQIIGVDPIREPEVSRLRNFVSHGEWLSENDTSGVLLGSDLAVSLEVEIGDKIVMMSQGPRGEIVSEAFLLRGILTSGMPDIDRSLALITLNASQVWLAIGNGSTEIVVHTNEFEEVDLVADSLTERFSDSLDIIRWYDRDPMIQQMLEMQDASRLILIAVVISVVLGQLINIMFMSFYDRVPEFGLMEALGSRRRYLFLILFWESLLLVLLGGVIGYLLAFFAVIWTASIGIDLSAFGDTLSTFYIDPILRPTIDLKSTAYLLCTLFVTAVLAGLFPAWRATRLNPIEALRKI